MPRREPRSAAILKVKLRLFFFIALIGLSTQFGLIPAARGADRVIYDDGLRNGFQDWSWATRSLTQSAVVHAGGAAVSFEPDGWAGIYFHVDAGLTTDAYEAFDFWIHGGAAGGQALTVALYTGTSLAGSAPLANYLPGGVLPGGQWVHVRVPFADLGLAAGVMNGFCLQDRSGGDQATVYVDDILVAERTGPPPEPTTVAVSVNPAADRRPVNPLIYGVSFGEAAQLDAPGFTVRRWGGNHTTRYSWLADTGNRAMDWFFLNIPEDNPHPERLPDDSSADVFVDETLDAGREVLLTVPLIGWTPRDRAVRWGFSVQKYGAQTETECSASGYPDWCRADAGNGILAGGAEVTGNDPADTSVAIGPDFVADWIDHLVARNGTAAQGGIRFYALDNEPMLWNSTHRDVHSAPATYDEIWQRTVDYAAAVRAADPSAEVLGPVVWGWCAYFTSAADGCPDGPDRQAHGGLPFLEWYLQQVTAYEQAHGIRLVDYLDIHYYPQGGIYSASEAIAEQRLRSVKSLYDPAYVDESWIGQAVRLIPRMKEWIAARAPAVKLAITEYSWGTNDASPSNALAQAEVLSVFAREGVDLATRWVAPDADSLVEDAFRLYLDYDGGGARVTGESARALSANVDQVGAYAQVRGDGRLYVLLFNKDTVPHTAAVSVAGGDSYAAELYRFDATHRLGPAGTAAAPGGALTLELPARSATLAVLDPSAPPYNGYGDLDLDGEVARFDAQIMADYLAGSLRAGDVPFVASPDMADLDGDGRITVTDLVILKAHLDGSIPALPVSR